jgi:tetratricopeptide (TPR) repeat protein
MWIKTADLADETASELLDGGRFSEAAALTPQNAAQRFAKGIALLQLGQGRAGTAELEPLVKDPVFGAAATLELALSNRRRNGGKDSEAAIAALTGIGPAAAARAKQILGLIQSDRLEHHNAVRELRAAADGFDALGLTAGSAQVNDSLGSVYASLGQIEAALAAYARSLSDKTALGDRLGVAITFGNLGRLCLQTGRFADARAFFQNDIVIAKDLGDVRGQARCLNDLGRVLIAEGRGAEAAETLDAAVRMAREMGDETMLLFALKDKADALGPGNSAAAEAIAEARALQARSNMLYARLQIDLVEAKLRAKSDPQAALELLERAIADLEYDSIPDVEMQARLLATELYAAAGRTREAAATLLIAVKRCRARGLVRYERDLREAMSRYEIEPGIAEEVGRSVSSNRTGTLDGYLLLTELGAGAFGSVWHATDLRTGKDVAYKQLMLDSVYDRASRETFLDSLRLELEAAARVKHKAVAEVYAIGRDSDGNPYVVQQLVRGKTLRKVHGEGGIRELPRICQYMAMIAHGVSALHAGGVVHRDLKPENIVITDAGDPVLIDFGIAHVANLKLKNFKGGAGTKGYAPPEQSQAGAADTKLDIYALGVIAWEWFAGSRPEKGLASLPDPSAKKGMLSGLFGAKEKTYTDFEAGFIALVRTMMAPAAERPASADAVARSFEKLAAAGAKQ